MYFFSREQQKYITKSTTCAGQIRKTNVTVSFSERNGNICNVNMGLGIIDNSGYTTFQELVGDEKDILT